MSTDLGMMTGKHYDRGKSRDSRVCGYIWGKGEATVNPYLKVRRGQVLEQFVKRFS